MFRREFLMATSVVACAAAASGMGGGPARPRSLSIFEHVSLDGYFTDAGRT